MAPDPLPLPMRATAAAAAFDLQAALRASFTLAPGDRALFPTGFAVGIPQGYTGLVCPRSGLALKKGITVLNAPGVIDADYRGEIGVVLYNSGREAVTFARGDRIAQLMIVPCPECAPIEVAELSQTARAEGGFGSTGR